MGFDRLSPNGIDISSGRINNTKAGRANDLGLQNQGVRKSIEELRQVQEHAEIFRLLALVIEQANTIQGTVENARNDCLPTK